MPTSAEHRKSRIAEAVGQMKSTIAREGESRESLARVLAVVQGLAAEPGLWPRDAFPDPPEGELQVRYLVHRDPDDTYALYLNVIRPGRKVVPHNHTTWACIAAVEGVEENRVYRRLDAGGCPGPARLEEVEMIPVQPGRGIALMPDDIHSVTIPAGQVIRHLHMYGRALEALHTRVAYDLEKGTCERLQIGKQVVASTLGK